MAGKEYSSLSDEDFLNGMYGGEVTLKMYNTEVIKKIYISNFLTYIYSLVSFKKLNLTKEEIDIYVNNHKEDFITKAYIMLSMIYVSFYDGNGIALNKRDIKKKGRLASDCLKELKQNEKFEDLVSKYSDDLISKQSVPKGNVGRLILQKDFLKRKFSDEIIQLFMSKKIGVIKKIYKTKDGLYIFNIREHKAQSELPLEIKEMKAKDLLEKEFSRDQEKEIRKTKLKELIKKFDVIIY